MANTAPVRPTLVLVDDDAAVGDSLKFALEFDGFEVRTYDSAEAMLAEALPAGPVCLVIDLNLPAMDGLQLLRLVREQHGGIPVVFITTHPTQRLRQQVAALDAPIVEKPLLSDGLVDTVRRVMAASA